MFSQCGKPKVKDTPLPEYCCWNWSVVNLPISPIGYPPSPPMKSVGLLPVNVKPSFWLFLGFLGLNCVIPSISRDPMRLKPDGFWKFIPVVVGDVETLVETDTDGGGRMNEFSGLFVLGERLFSCLVDGFSSI